MTWSAALLPSPAVQRLYSLGIIVLFDSNGSLGHGVALRHG